MRATASTQRGLTTLAVALGVLIPVAAGVLADDTDLFTTSVPPNVMIIVDNSGSMNHVVWHPLYHPDAVYTDGNCANPGEEGYNPECLKHPLCNISFGDFDFLGVGNSWSSSENAFRTEWGKTVDKSDEPDCNQRLAFDAGPDQTYWDIGYLRWYFSDNVEENDPEGDGTILEEILKTDNGRYSQCLLDADPTRPATYSKYRRNRVAAAQGILREVICNTNQVAEIRYGLAKFNPTNVIWTEDPDGGYVNVPIDAYTEDHADDLEGAIEGLEGETFTPVAETLYMIYRYFQSRDGNKTAWGKDGEAGGVRFDPYPVDINGNVGGDIPPHPVTDDCQKHFVVLITDGTPRNDDFDGMDEFFDVIGDYYQPVGDEVEEPGGGVGRYLDDVAKFMHEHDFMLEDEFPSTNVIDVYTVGFTTGDDANDLLQRTANLGGGKFFASNNAEELTIAITRTINDIVTKAKAFTAGTVPASRATEGNNFFTSYFTPSAEGPFWSGHLKLFEFNGRGEIRDEPAGPGLEGECALEDPEPPRCQQGTLKLTLDGYWDAANGIPAPDNRNLYVSLYQGAPAAPIPSAPEPFTAANISASDLGVTGADAAEIGTYNHALLPEFDTDGITTDEELADAIVRYVRGCEFRDPSEACVDRGDGNKLWDIFHSDPIVVGPPNSALRDLTYRQFVREYKHRKRVIYAASNGGFVHGFNAGEYVETGDYKKPWAYNRGTGEETFGFMAYPARQNIAELPRDLPPRDYYYMDGPPTAGDIWLPPSPTAKPKDGTWNNWRTVLLGGMRQGGGAIWALDVTNPSGHAGGPANYPGYLWEFPCEASTCNTWRPYMGETWSKPVIARVKATFTCGSSTLDNRNWGPDNCATYDRWVAIFGGGYDPSGDPNMPWGDPSGTIGAGEYDPGPNNPADTDTLRAGRALFMVDIATGQVLGVRRFQENGEEYDDTDNSTLTNGEPGMKYAIASRPAVFDLDFDGYADVVYVGDLGGNVWKWLIHEPAEDHIRGLTGNPNQSRWKFMKIFEGENCTSCSPKHYKSFFFAPTGALVGQHLWLAFGSGERNDLDYGDGGVPDARARNRFYVLKDNDPFELERETADLPYTDVPPSTDFDDATTITEFNPNTCLSSDAVGFYFEGEDGEKFITESVIFFGVVLTGSYVPIADGGDPCTSSGKAYLYGFTLQCGEGVFPPESDGDPKQCRMEIGDDGGLPNSPRVSVAPVDPGDDDDDDECKDMVFVMTTSNQGFDKCLTKRPDSGVRVKSWRDF